MENHQAEQDTDQAEEHAEADDERRGDAVELRHDDQDDQEQGDEQGFRQEGQFLGLLLLLPRERIADPTRGFELSGEQLLHAGHDFVGVCAFEHVGAEGHHPVEVLPLHAREGRAAIGSGDSGNGDLLDLAIRSTPENHLLIHQGIHVVADLLRKPQVDRVIVLAILEGAHLTAEERRANRVADVLRREPVPAGLLAVNRDRQLRLLLVDIDLQFLDACKVRLAQELSHFSRCRQELVVIFTADFDVDWWALWRAVRIFRHDDLRVRVAAKSLAEGVEHDFGGLAPSLLELDEVDADAGLLGGIAQIRSVIRIARPVADLPDDRIHHVRFELTRFRVGPFPAVFRNKFENFRFDFLCDPVGLLEVGADGFGDEDVQELGFIGWKKLHLRRKGPQQHNGHDKKHSGAEEKDPRTLACQREPQKFLVDVFEPGQETVLERNRRRIKHIGVQEAHQACNEQNVAQRHRAQRQERPTDAHHHP